MLPKLDEKTLRKINALKPGDRVFYQSMGRGFMYEATILEVYPSRDARWAPSLRISFLDWNNTKCQVGWVPHRSSWVCYYRGFYLKDELPEGTHVVRPLIRK